MPPIFFYGRHATVASLGKGQYLAVRCGIRHCRHTGSVTPGTWPPRVPINTKLCDLSKLLRCTKCGRRSPETEVTVLRR
jgi:hypothetical protein